MFSKMRELPGGNRLPAKTDSRQDSQETKSKGNESNPRLSDEEKRSSGFEGREDDLLVVADHFQKGYHSDKIIRSTRDKTYLELEGQKEQLICKVLWDIESANDWTHTVPYKGGHENLDIEHYVMFALNDTVKWLDLVHIFPKNVIEQNIVGFILVNYQESLHVPDDFFGDQKLHDMFVCVIRHGDQHRMMSYIEEKSSAARVRIVRSTCVDLPEENSYCQGNHRSAASMLSEYFSVADANGLDLGLYCHIFSFLDNMSEFDKPKDGIEVVKNRLAKEKFQLAHFLLYCAMLYKMTKKGHYLEKKQPSKVKSCVKSFFNVLIEELNISISEISQIVNDHLLFDNVHVRDGSSDKQFFDFLGDACYEMYVMLVSFEKQWLGLQIMWLTLYVKFKLHNGYTHDQLKQTWRKFTEQPLHQQKLEANRMSIVPALELGTLLKIPIDLQLSGHQLGRIVVTVYGVESYGALKKILDNFNEILRLDENYLTEFLTKCYESFNMSQVHPSDRPMEEMPSIVTEGPHFILAVIDLLTKTSAANDQVLSRLLSWWSNVIQALMNEHASSMVQLMLYVDQYLSGDDHTKKQMKLKLDARFKEELPKAIETMDLENFIVYLQAIKDDRCPRKLVLQFLRKFQSRLPNGVPLLSAQCFIDLLAVYHSRWSRRIPAEEQRGFIDFVFKASQKYEERKKLNFLEDLLQLKKFPVIESGLEGVKDAHESFCTQLRDFIRAHRLGIEVCDLVHKVLDEGKEKFTTLEQLVYGTVIKVVCEDIPHTAKRLTEEAVDTWFVSKASVLLGNYYKSDPNKWCLPPDVPYLWYWEILVKLCRTIAPCAPSLWKNTLEPLRVATFVHGVYIQSCSDTKRTDIPPAVMQYQYFEWVAGVKDAAGQWKLSVEEGRCTLSELQDYQIISEEMKCKGSLILQRLDIGSMLPTEQFIDQKINAFEQYSQEFENLLHFDRRVSLIGILKEYNVQFPTSLVIKPLDTPNELFKQGSFYVQDDWDLITIQTLSKELQDFCAPLAPLKPFLVHFSSRVNSFFDAFYMYEKAQVRQVVSSTDFDDVVHDHELEQSWKMLRHPQTKQSSISMEAFCNILRATKESLKKLVTGQMPYSVLKNLNLPNGFMDVELRRNFEFVSSYPFEGVTRKVIMGGIEEILWLKESKEILKLLSDVCSVYDLASCLKDRKLEEAVVILKTLNSETEMSVITPAQAHEKLKVLKKNLDLPKDGGTIRKCVLYFKIVLQSHNFAKFLKDRTFYGPAGSRLFSQNVELLTSNLQYEEYQEDVLNNLWIAYEFISPFLNGEIELQDFLNQVYHVCSRRDSGRVQEPFYQLKNVNENIDLIYLWFSEVEGNPLEEFKHILEKGHFEFALQSTRVDELPQDGLGHDLNGIVLKFPPLKRVTVDGQPVLEVVWNKEDIDDFIRQLGLLETCKEAPDFLYLVKMANKIQNLQWKMKKLGYREHMHSSLSCKCKPQEAQFLEQKLCESLNKWEKMLSNLAEGCPMLLLLSIPKILRMVDILHEKSSEENVVTCLAMEMDCLRDPQEITESGGACIIAKDIPKPYSQEVVLTALKNIVERCISSPKKTIDPSSTKAKSILHLATNCKPSDIFEIIFCIHGCCPKAYQIIRCCSSTTREDINHFFKRSATFQWLPFTMLAVNLLSAGLQEHLVQLHNQALQNASCCQIHYIATGPTMLQDMPRISVEDHTTPKPKDSNSCRKLSREVFSNRFDVKLVYGKAGDGKSHFIQKEMKKMDVKKSIVITVNELFSPLTAINKLKSLALHGKSIIHFNFTFLPPRNSDGNSDDNFPTEYDRDQSSRGNIFSEIECFFFDLFYLHYVEDYESGISFALHHVPKWTFFIEVPMNLSRNNIDAFYERYPILYLLGTPVPVHSGIPYDVDADVQLVCKYLRAYELCDDPIRGKKEGIDKVCPRSLSAVTVPIKFSDAPDLTHSECNRLLEKYMEDHVRVNKLQEKLFVGYMKRRCMFMENFPAFNYNDGHYEKLGSTVMNTMLKEVNDFCSVHRRDGWSSASRQLLVYECTSEGDGRFHLFTMDHDSKKVDIEKFKGLKICPPNPSEIHSRECLDGYLAAALNVPLNPMTKRIDILDRKSYVLTLDYFLKMLEIHERMESGIPVIIEGETGVGKTALLEMLSLLWNASLMDEHRKFLERFSDEIERIFDKFAMSEGLTKSFVTVMEGVKRKETPPLDDVLHVCQGCLTEDPKEKNDIAQKLASFVKKFVREESINVLDFASPWKEIQNSFPYKILGNVSFISFWKDCIRDCDCVQGTNLGIFVYCLFKAQTSQVFHKMPIHSALSPADIGRFLKPIIDQAKELKEVTPQSRPPRITVFFDEINTSSCPGLLKEITVDRTFLGKPLPENLFIVAACNPHRGNSLILKERNCVSKNWTRGTYYVHPLHPTMEFLKWDYGALNEEQELLYVQQKMEMVYREITYDKKNENAHVNVLTVYLSKLITSSQNFMRKCAERHVLNVIGLSSREAREWSYSCVSQRDIQRVFTFLKWLRKCYRSESFKERFPEDAKETIKFQTAVLVSLGLVYYVRLGDYNSNEDSEDHESSSYKSQYVAHLTKITGTDLRIDNVFREELEFYAKKLSIPSGIAMTRALIENMFCVIACCCTRTPLIITGPPGSSKTLSFSLTLDNIKGRKSTLDPFKDFELFPSLAPHYYQCSKLTTSTEVETVFQRAVKRQRKFNAVELPINCVVFMDEAGLPEESLESLKILHKFLDNPEVSFVAITNSLLDAAKTNRAVSLFRSRYVKKDLYKLMDESLPDVPTIANCLCETYFELEDDDSFQAFFGLRDFIHLGYYLRRNRQFHGVDAQLLMKAIERNFNGYPYYDDVCESFLRAIGSSPMNVSRRSAITVLRNSLSDKQCKEHSVKEASKVRYKLVIDSSEDEAVTRLLYAFNIVDPATTRTYMCSSFPEDGEVQKINTIAAVRHAIRKGFTIVMTQTGSIHGSFYDVFNQYFKVIEDPEKGTRFYANIAIGSNLKQCQVHRDFQCIVVIKRSELRTTPGPFLNRFEKYSLSHKDFLEARLVEIPPNFRIVIIAVQKKVKDFLECFEYSSFYGAVDGETLHSLILSILPECGFIFEQSNVVRDACTMTAQGRPSVLQYILRSLSTKAGMRFLTVSFGKECTWTINTHDATGKAFLGGLYNYDEVISHVDNAMKYLLSKDPNSIHITAEEQFVISVIGQWLVVYLCKRLINLMTAEGFIFGQMKMPTWCLETYLIDQHHFSLKSTIQLCLKELQVYSFDGGLQHRTVTNKIMCFTHSSPELHGLPPLASDSIEHTFADVQNLVHDEFEKVHLLKMSSIFTEKAFEEHVKHFIENLDSCIMVIVIDMQETSASIVNHARIMVEEIEKSVDCTKLFLFLLHFPSSLYHKPCYPAIFAPGWDHCYLDTALPQTLDMRQWFQTAFQPNDTSQQIFDEAMLNAFRQDAIGVISSRVLIGSTNGGGFNSKCGHEKEKLRRFEKLLSSPVGNKLVGMYVLCWKKADVAFCLKEAAEHTRRNMSQLSITEVVQDHFRTTFFNFLSFMIHIINTELNIDVIFDIEDAHSKTLALFLNILSVWPLPKLAEIKAYNNTFDSRQMEAVKPSFPFFWKVCSALDQLVEESIKEYQQKRPLDDDSQKVASPRLHRLTERSGEIINCVLLKMKEHKTDVLGLALTALDEDPQLWENYKRHFLSSRCHVTDLDKPAVAAVVTSHFHKAFSLPDVNERLVHLHYQTLTEPKDLALFADLLLPGSPDTRSGPVAEESFVSELFAVFSSGRIDEDNVEFSRKVEELALWHSRMLQKISHPTFNEWNFKREYNAQHQSKLHVMMTVFFLMQMRTSSFSSNIDIRYQFIVAVRHHLLQLIKQEQNIFLSSVMDCITNILEEFSSDLAQHEGKEIIEAGVKEPVADRAERILSLPIDIKGFLEVILQYFINGQRRHDKLGMKNIKWFVEDINQLHEKGTMWLLMHTSQERVNGNPLWNLQVNLLGEILSCCPKGAAMASPLCVFNVNVRDLVGRELCAKSTAPFSYVPPVYRNAITSHNGSENDVSLAHPLADAYYLCLMEHWGSLKDIELSVALNFICEIRKQMQSSKEDSRTILLLIEYQAAIQVALQSFVSDAVLHYRGIKATLPEVNCIQSIIDGNASDSHKKMIMVLFLRQLKSPFALNEFLGSRVAEDLSPVLDVPSRNRCHSEQPLPHIFPFMQPSANGCLADAYKSVKTLMDGIARDMKKSMITDSERNLKKLLRKGDLFKGHQGLEIDKRLFMKMSVWLVTYYEYFLIKRTSPLLVESIEDHLSFLEFTPEQICILECFLTPQRFVVRKENRAPEFQAKCDPLHDLFMCTQTMTGDSSLCHVIANMVGVGFSLPQGKTHLWSFLFEPKALVWTRLPGFKSKAFASLMERYARTTEAGPIATFYESDPGPMSVLSLHSLYVMMFFNLGALSVAMLTWNGAQDVICGNVLPRVDCVRHFFADNLKCLWKNLLFCVEEDVSLRPFLLTQCLQKVLQVVHTEKKEMDSKFMNSDDIHKYEAFWHTDIYAVCQLKLGIEYEQQVPLMREDFFATTRDAAKRCLQYPHVITMKHDLIEYVGLRSNGPQILLKFMNVYECLSVGSTLLPKLIKVYKWLNTHLAHLITYEKALVDPVDHILQRASKRFPKGSIAEFHTMKENFNEFVDLCGGFLQDGDGMLIRKIQSTTEIVKLLTVGDGNDWLCRTVDIIVRLHNDLIHLMKEEGRLYSRWLLPQSLRSQCSVTLFSQHLAIVWANPNLTEELTRLFHSRCSYGNVSASATGRLYQWEELECDVVRKYIVGKPKLLDASSGLRKPFRFRTVLTGHSSTGMLGMTSPGHPVDLAALDQELPEDYKNSSSLSMDNVKELELAFHNLDYSTLSKLVENLRIAAGKLCEKLLQQNESVHHEEPLEVLFTQMQLSESFGTFCLQESILMKFKVAQLYQILVMFVSWIDTCYYTFSELPYSLKTDAPMHLKKYFTGALREASKDDLPTRLDLIKDLESVLSHALTMGSSHLIQQQSFLIPLSTYVGKYNLCEQKLWKLIPRDIQLQHIVHFVLFLRRVKIEMENDPSQADPALLDEWKDEVELYLPNFEFRHIDFSLSQDQPQAGRTRYASSSEVTVWPEQRIAPKIKQNALGPLTEWTASEVTEWLESINLGEYVKVFIDNEVVGEKFMQCNAEMLEEIGVNRKCERIKILTRIQRKDVETGNDSNDTGSVSEWSVEQISDWLESINLGEFSEQFREEEVSGDELLQYDHICLEEIGVSSKPSRIKILTKFKAKDASKGMSTGSGVLQWTVHEVTDWLKSIKFERYAQMFEDKEVDGAELVQYDPECLIAIGVKKKSDRLSILSELKKCI